MPQPLSEEELLALVDVWDTAERRIKRTERIKSTLTIPAINELRYAGYHFIRAGSANNDETRAENVSKAAKHCKRATYDAVEAEVLYYLECIRVFQDDYRLIIIDVPGFNYQAVRKRARESMDFIVNVKNEAETRDQHYARLIDLCEPLRETVGEIDDAREELNKRKTAAESAAQALAEANQRESELLRTEARRYKITTVIAFAVFVVLAGRMFYEWRPAGATPPPPSIGVP